MNPARPALAFVLVASSGIGLAQTLKTPGPLAEMPDVKTAAVVPHAIVGASPTRIVPADYTPAAPLGPKVAPAAGDAQPGFGPDFSVVRFDEPGDGALWVRGRTYKARFDANGATYIPALGSSAPRNHPLRVELASVRVGGQAIALESAKVVRQGESITLDHGTVREVWHMGLESAEQTFVLGARIAGDAELRLAFETDLEARATDAGIAFDGPDGGVRISGAVAIDAAGRRLALATRLDAGEIAIDLPAAFGAAADYPIVIDPVFSTYALEGYANPCGSPDIANSGVEGRWCATFVFAYSATDGDVWAQDVYYGQPVAGTGMWVDSTSNSWSAPRIAYNALHDTYCVVAYVYQSPSRIVSRAHYAATTAQLAQVVVESGSGGNCFDPDIGGDPTLLGPTYFFAAWTRQYSPTDFDVHGRRLNWDGTPNGGLVLIENTTAFDALPRISKTDGHLPYDTQRWNVVWRRGPSTGDVYGAQLGWDGQLVTPAFAIDTTTADDFNPSASSVLDGATGPRPWMVAFTRDHGDTDIEARVLVGGSNLGGINVSVREYSAIYENQGWPDVDTNGQRFVLTYSESYLGSATDRDQYVTTLHWNGVGVVVDEPHQNVDYSGADSVYGQISGCMNDTSQGYPYYGLAWPQGNDVRVGAYYEPEPIESTCFGDGSASFCPCGNTGGLRRGCANSVTTGALLLAQGHPYLSADDMVIGATDMPPTAACLFFQATGIGSTGTSFGDGLRCILGTTIRIGTKTAVGGSASYPEAGDPPISVRGQLPADGGSRGYQAWYRNAASFCTPATFNMSSGVRVIWMR